MSFLDEFDHSDHLCIFFLFLLVENLPIAAPPLSGIFIYFFYFFLKPCPTVPPNYDFRAGALFFMFMFFKENLFSWDVLYSGNHATFVYPWPCLTIFTPSILDLVWQYSLHPEWELTWILRPFWVYAGCPLESVYQLLVVIAKLGGYLGSSAILVQFYPIYM